MWALPAEAAGPFLLSQLTIRLAMTWLNPYRGRDDRGALAPMQRTAWRRAVEIGPLVLIVPSVAVIALAYWTSASMDLLWVGLCGIVVGMGLRLAAREETWVKLMPRRLDEGRCPVCEYRLDNLAVEEDGCTVCPECGAAWRLAEQPGTPSSP